MPTPKKKLTPAKPVTKAAASRKPAVKAKPKPFSGNYQWYNADGSPNEATGLYTREGLQGRFDKDVKRDKFEKQPKTRTKEDMDAARRSGYAR